MSKTQKSLRVISVCFATTLVARDLVDEERGEANHSYCEEHKDE